jgi:small basic protein (TIGR04137 family)
MSMDPSLKSASSLVRHRNVLTRAERLAQLKDEEKWNESKSVFGLPKVGHRKMDLAKPVKEAAVEGVEAGAVAAPAAKGAKGAPAAKGAAPAGKGAPAAKGAAPAAKGAAPAAKKK